MRDRMTTPEPPLVAVEVRPRGIGVVRLEGKKGRARLAAAVSLDLPASALTLSMTHPNVTDADAFGRTLQGAAERAGVLSGAAVGLILPDPVMRVALWPAAEMKGQSGDEARELIRFKLRKTVPFDVREAQVDWSLEPGAEHVVVVAIHRPVLRSYEDACLAAGLRPGLVQPAGLALLGASFAEGPAEDRLLVNWDDGYLSLLLARAGRLVLARTLSGEAVTDPAAAAREVANTALYYRERLGGGGFASALVRSTALPIDDAIAALAAAAGTSPRPVDPWATLSGQQSGAGAQGLAGAAACLVWAHAA
jgi:hypothetical protein